MNRPVSIYVLFDRKFPEHYRYVGKTVSSAYSRNLSHLFEAIGEHFFSTRCHKCNWIKQVLNSRSFVYHKVVDTCDELNQSDFERYYVAKYSVEGHDLTNMTDGGEGLSGISQSPEVIAKRTNTMKEKYLVDGKYTCYKNRNWSYTAIEAMLKARKLIPYTWGSKIATSLKEFYATPEGKETLRLGGLAIGNALRGRKCSQESTQKKIIALKKRHEQLRTLHNEYVQITGSKIHQFNLMSVKNLESLVNSIRKAA